MFAPPISILSTLAATLIATTSVHAQDFEVPVPWTITGLNVQNTRHGTGGFWQFTINDTTACPQGIFEQSCYYYGESAAFFASSDFPVFAPCNDDFPELTFGFGPDVTSGFYLFNITHRWGDYDHVDVGSWLFSVDDVRGEEDDVGNNFAQYGSFQYPSFEIYPERSTPSTEPWIEK